MGDLLQKGAQWLEGKRHEHLAHEITYSRTENGITTQVVMDATPGIASYSEIDANGITFEISSRDYLVRASDFTFGQPKRGDRITEVIDGVSCVFEAMNLAGGKPWQWSDATRRTLRIHTKAIDGNS